MARVIVVGGGLSGLSAAHTVLERGGSVILLDKNPFMGGNSTKATSGINGALTKTQVKLGIQDSVEIFEKDTALSASKGEHSRADPLAKVLTHNSGRAVEWLQERFNLDLSLVSRLGGHSQPRTHRGKERFPGMTITYALMQALEAIAEKNPEKAQIKLKARVKKLIKGSDGEVIGCEYEHDGKTHRADGPVVLATGGYGAGGLSDDSLLHKVRPDLTHLPTTNGTHCTGDGVTMVQEIGGGTVGLDFVQVHPTGLVNLKDPKARVKFLAAEALRGCGGLLLDNEGNRFCNELGRRDYVSGEMFSRKKGPYRLVLNGNASNEIAWHCKHYTGRGIMKRYSHGSELAKDMGISVDKLQSTFDEYNKHASNKSDPFGKKFFKNGPLKVDDLFHVGIVEPVVHYCMSGISVDTDARVITDSSELIDGLFGAGEVVGGVHGKNRLGGSALLECVVFGRVAGASAARYQMEKLTTERASGRVARLTGQLLPGGVVVNVDQAAGKVTLEIGIGGGSSAPAPAQQASSAAESAPAAPAQEEAAADGVFTKEEVAKHNTEDDCWVIVNGQVLDVTKFLDDHPGGKGAILLFAGKDATDEFNMLHTPDVVEKYAKYTIRGTLKE